MNWGASKFGGVNPVWRSGSELSGNETVAEKCGFVEMAITDYQGKPWLLMEHLS